MADQKQSIPPSEPTRPRTTRGQQRRNQNSVFRYVAILFAAAFILLLFTFLMERRQNQLLLEESEQQIDSLQQSVSAVQSLQGLYQENDALKQIISDLEDEIAALKKDDQEKINAINALDAQLIRTKAAMDWFWQIDEAYVRGRIELCRSLIQNLQRAQLEAYLPRESITNNDRFAPYDRYMEILDAVY